MREMIQALVGTSLENATRRSGPVAAAAGIVAALRRLRSVAEEQGGTAFAANLDTLMTDRLIAAAMQTGASGSAERPELPAATAVPGAHRAVAMLEDTADTILAFNPHTPNNAALTTAIEVLVQKLVERLGGAPDWQPVLTAVQGGVGWIPGLPPTAGTLAVRH